MITQIQRVEVDVVSAVPTFTAPDFDQLLSEVANEYPIDGREIVEWMHYAEAANRAAEYTAMGYRDAGGLVDWVSGDGNIPGVKYQYNNVVYRFRRMAGRAVREGGGAYVEPGNIYVPLGYWRWVRFPNLLAAVPMAWWYQWLGLFLAFLRLARIPVRRSIAFTRVYGTTLPLVFRDTFALPTPVATYVIEVSVNRDSRMWVRFHHNGTVEREVRLQAGVNRVVMVVLFPSMSGYVELVPENGVRAELISIERVP